MPLLRLLYGSYAWLQFTLLGVLSLPVLLLMPSLPRRRALIRRLAGWVLRLAGMRLQACGIEVLPMPCIVVANHSSYLDGVVLAATLPAAFSFVIKREMSRVPLAGLLLRRIGAEFVERHDRHRGAQDARRLLRSAGQGQPCILPRGHL